MTLYSPTYRDKIVEAYHEIKDISNESVIAFYEKNRQGIEFLDIEDQFEMLARYTKALFLTSAYTKHIHVADEVIEKSIFHNIQFIQGVDVYSETLFDKAASYYNIHKTDESIKILKALLHLDGKNKTYRYLLQCCYLHKKPRYVQMGRAISVLFALSAAFVIGVELIFVRTMANEYTALVEGTRNALLVFSIGILIFSELIFRASAYLRSIKVAQSSIKR